MDNKLLLAVRFDSVDKMTGALKNITRSGKDGAKVLKGMKDEARKLDKELGVVRNKLVSGLAGGAPLAGLIQQERELAAAAQKANAQLATQKARFERVERFKARAGRLRDGAATAGAVSSAALTLPLIAFGKEASKAAMDAGELQSAFDTTFGKNAAMMNRWADQQAKALGRSRVEMRQAANTFGLYFNQVTDPKNAVKMTQTFGKLAQDLGSFFNTDTETAIQKLQSGLSGEAEPLRQFGVFMTDAAIKAQAAKMGIKAVGGELTENQKILARYGFIMEKTKVAQGDIARTSQSDANRLRASQAALADTQVRFGQEVNKALPTLLSAGAKLLGIFNSMSPSMQKWTVVGFAVLAFLGPMLLGIAGLAAAAGALPAIIGGVGAALGFLLSPIGLIVAGIVGLVAAVYFNWDKIKAAFNAGAAWLSGFGATMSNIGRNIINGLINGIMALGPTALAKTLISIGQRGVAAFKNFFGIKSPSRLFMGFGGYMSEGLAIGIDKGAKRPLRAVARLATGVAGAGAMSLSPAFGAGPAMAPAGGPRAQLAATGGQAPINITINAAPGQDAKAIADEVMRRLERAQGVKARSSYDDN